MNKKEHFFKELNRKDDENEFYSENMDKIWRTWTTVYNERGGYIESDLSFILYKDGSFMVSENDGDDAVSMSKEELNDLISIIGKIKNDSKS